MPRQSPDDSGHRNEYGQEECPRCGKWITKCGYGRKSHIKACLKRIVVVDGKRFPPANNRIYGKMKGENDGSINFTKTFPDGYYS